METFKQSTFEEYNKYLISVLEESNKIQKIYHELDLDESLISKFKSDTTLSEREFVELIALFRRRNYSLLAGGANKAAEQETDRLYAKNPWKFIEEFLQNADDCEYKELPKVDITIDENNKTVEFVYNEKGFSRNDIWAITAFSQSTKQENSSDLLSNVSETGIFYKEKTGRKGKGFKAVFSLNAENIIVHIRSNGFSFKLDNKIGRIMPVWENDPNRIDGKTHILVEFINPKFDFIDAFSELKKLFCVENVEKIFEKSPFIFMHRIKDVHVSNIGEKKEEFETFFDIDETKNIYEKIIQVNSNKTVLAGIKHDGNFYENIFQQGKIIAYFQGKKNEISIIKYTKMVEDYNCYRNYSILAPVLKSDVSIEWERGSLFRTFPMSSHSFNMPFAIDAPFELNPDRSGIQYRDEKMETINASEWNNIVSKEVFGESGLFETFMLWLRNIDGIRIDKYVRKEKNELFNVPDNRNNDSYWVTPVDISEISQKLEIFKLFMNTEGFVSYTNAQTVNQRLFSWPNIDILFTNILGEDFKKKLLSELYIGSNLFNAKPIVKPGFVEAFNIYIDYIENKFETQDDFFKFVSTEIFSFFKENSKSIKESESNAFSNLKIYFSTLKDGTSYKIIREPLSEDKIWISSKNKEVLSINNFRVLETSPVKLSMLQELSDGLFKPKDISDYFSEQNLKSSISKYDNWKEIKEFIEAALYYNYSIAKLNISNKLSKFALSENYDKDFNPFRDSNIVTIIDDSDVEELSEYFGSVQNVVSELKRLGLKKGYDFFKQAGNNVDFREDTLQLFEKSENLSPVLTSIEEALKKNSKKISTSYDSIKNIQIEALNFFLNEEKKLLVEEDITNICNRAQEDSYFWNNIEKSGHKEFLLRVCSRAAKDISNKESRRIILPVEEVLKNKLEKCVTNAAKRIGYLEVTNNGFFEEINNYEIKPFIHVISPEKEDSKNKYYKGNLHKFGGAFKFLSDGRAGNVYLNIEDGDYKAALTESLHKGIDSDLLNTLDEMERKYRTVNTEIIQPMFKTTNGDLKRTYELIEKEFEDRSKEEIISILSWFRYSGYTNALGNGNIQNEKEIEDDYKNSPWKFIYEFIQNVDDCEYSDEKPKLNIKLDKEKGQIQFDYNEIGFSLEDIKSLTKFGDSTKTGTIEKFVNKEGIFDLEKTGRKGRGFKSVFSLPGSGIVVHICSNGFNFKFEKRLGSIIPIWEDIEDAPSAGTRIIVEGFDKEYAGHLSSNIEEMFGVKSIESLTAKCPVLYLRKLDTISVSNGDDNFFIKFEKIKENYSDDEYETNGKSINAGIINNGLYKKSVSEYLNISIVNNKTTNSFKALRYSELIDISNSIKLASVFSPIMTENENINFTEGALYRVLPLDENKLSIPLAINLPFITNSGRSAVADNKENNELCKKYLNTVIRHFYDELRTIEDICIEKYIPKNDCSLFENSKYLLKIGLRNLIKDFDILRSFDGSIFVSCNHAKTLTKSCYDWDNPSLLAECFSNTNNILIQKKYAAKNITAENILLNQNNQFVSNLNKYLDSLNESNQTLISLFQEHIYKYIKTSCEILKHNYIDTPDELKQMRIFIFEMDDGTYIRECADDKSIWMKNVPAKYSGYGKYRNISKGSLPTEFYNTDWVKHEIFDFENAFTSTNLASSRIKDWAEASELLKTILYYDIQKELNIPYLKNCVLNDEFDHRQNIFRDAFRETNSNDILNHIITRNDLIEIEKIKASTQSENSLQKLANLILGFGLREENEVFNEPVSNIYTLNNQIKAVLLNYCDDYDTAGRVVDSISNSLAKLKNKNSNSKLQLTYDEIKNCDASVFAQIFAQDFLTSEIQEEIASHYCESFTNNENLDSAEAFFRATLLTDKINNNCELKISVNDISERSIGSYIRDGFLRNKNYEKIRLIIFDDNQLISYDSEIINKALKIIDNDSVQITYEYYVTDLEKAFAGQKGAKFLVDNTKVILNKSTADQELLAFIKRRFTNDETEVSLLFDLFGRQHQLQSGWVKTKREYIRELAEYRRIEQKQINLLCPGYTDFINQATENPFIYVIPELLQNINDCKKADNQKERLLEVNIDKENGTMLLKYNEAGFDFSNVYSITAIGQSSKHDASEGEKGLGFKKVFTLFNKVEIYSNGFAFSLTKENNTIPEWIDNKTSSEPHTIPGKTIMKFTIRPGNKENLIKISDSWEKLVKGDFLGSEYSPLFLKNIDIIRVNGSDEEYKRIEIENNFIFKNVNILSSFKCLAVNETNPNKIEEIIQILKTRRKCKIMSPLEADDYINNLSFEIAIPRKSSDMSNKGAVYSTLPTEIKLNSNIFINIPLELTTARDKIDLTSEYNRKVIQLIFEPNTDIGYSIFSKTLEEIAASNKELFAPSWFGTDFEKFKSAIISIEGSYDEAIFNHLINAKILKAYKTDEMINLNQSYTISELLFNYLNSIKTTKNDIDNWMQNNSTILKNDQYSLVLPERKKDFDSLFSFVKGMNLELSMRFPIEEDDSLDLKYLKDEYDEKEEDINE